MSSKADIHSDDYFAVLGVKRDASEAEIAKAYKKAALKHHPDKNPDRRADAEEEFKKLTEAYDVLRCPDKRQIYTQHGKAGLNGGNPQSGESGSDFSFSGNGAPRQSTMTREQADMIFGNLFGGNDPFANMFGDASDMGGSSFMFQSAQPGSGGISFQGMDFGAGFPGGSSGFPFARRQARKRTRSGGVHGGRSKATPYHVVRNGSVVVIHSLNKCPEHNGKMGHITDWSNVKGRYEVQLFSRHEGMEVTSDVSLWLRPHNITQLCEVEVTGLSSKPELNGRTGKIVDYDGVKRRYIVHLDGSGEALALQPANCIFSPQTCIVVDGLSKTECNGKMARIVDLDRPAARYTVECANGQRLKIKYENVLV